MKTVDEIIRAVAELPDRNSPEGQPEMMLVTGDELREIVEAALKEREAPPKAQPMSDAMFLERLLRDQNQSLRNQLEAAQAELAAIRSLKPTAYYYKYMTPFGDEVWSTEIPGSRTASEVVALYALPEQK